MQVENTERLLTARKVAAQIVTRDGPAFLPIFDRLDREVEQARAREVLLDKAKRIADAPLTAAETEGGRDVQ